VTFPLNAPNVNRRMGVFARYNERCLYAVSRNCVEKTAVGRLPSNRAEDRYGPIEFERLILQ
jgi:hypothetical protein